jgi:heme-degrading monooxygenase HmoA
MDGVIRGKVSAQLPSTSTGRYGGTPASSAVTVFLLGMQVNHPLGLLAPGTREIGEHFAQMQADMEAHGDEYGLLGSSSWRADQERDTMNQFLTVYYFKDVEGISKFAHGPVHRAAWDYYNKAKLTHIGFMHEMFSVPRSAYESLYLNCRPNLMGLLRVQVRSEEKGGREEWMSPLVKANKGALRSSFGRLGRSEGKELEQYGEEPAWHESRYRE